MASTFPPKISPTLMTPEPHFIPGYSGFCPQYRYNLGRTYGKLTNQLLSSKDIQHSGQLVLQSCPFPPPKDSDMDHHQGVLRWRRPRLGDKKLTWSMIPGYTGFIPRSQNFFAKTYAEVSKEAMGDFKTEQLLHETQLQEQALINKMQTGQQQPHTEHEKKLLTAKYRTPLPALSKEPAPFHSLHASQPHISPYYMDDENPHKYFISGYTGYVPRSRFLIGGGYPVTTNRALQEFGQMALKQNVRLSQQPESQGGEIQHPEQNPIYLESLGLLPRYTGYVPGYKFQYGHTYGHLTHNALGQSTQQKQIAN